MRAIDQVWYICQASINQLARDGRRELVKLPFVIVRGEDVAHLGNARSALGILPHLKRAMKKHREKNPDGHVDIRYSGLPWGILFKSDGDRFHYTEIAEEDEKTLAFALLHARRSGKLDAKKKSEK